VRKAWDDACRQLSASETEAPLGLEDLERLAMAAHLTGRDEECAQAWARAHNERFAGGRTRSRARYAFWGFGLFIECWMDCADRGYLLVPTALGCLEAGNQAGALTT
jgi:hypothetical protein